MFDFAWSEIALIGVVALVLIGPKDMPVAIKAISAMVKKARRMAAEFQTHFDDMMKEADLHEVREGIRQIRSMDLRSTIVRAVDTDGTMRQAFTEPVRTPPPVVTTPAEAIPQGTADVLVTDRPEHSIAAPEPTPAFIPPAAAETPAPAFIPPEAAAYSTGAAHQPDAGA